MSGYDIAKKMIGLHEIRDRKKIADFLKVHSKKRDIAIDPASTPWCAAVMNAWERAAGNPGNGRLNARSFLNYGTRVPLSQAREGDIVIFKRGNSTWQGHVAYYVRMEKTREGRKVVRTVGGNQSNAVTVGWYEASRVLGVVRYE